MEIRMILKEQLERRKEKNTQYSLRAFARDIGCSPGFLSRVLSEKMEVSERQILKMSPHLDIDEGTLVSILAQIRQKGLKKEYDLFEPIHQDLFQYASSPEVFVILELFNLKDFTVNAVNVANYLGISEVEAQDHIERLERLKLVRRDNEAWIPVNDNNATVHEQIPHAALTQLQKAFLLQAQDALEHRAFAERMVNTLTFSFKKADIEQVRKILYRSFKEINDLSVQQQGECDEVYNLTVALSPASQIEG